MKLHELVVEASEFGEGTSISDYEKYAKWIEEAKERCFEKFDEDESQWKKFEAELAKLTSKVCVDVFMAEPSADQLHYNSNGKPDQRKTLEFLESFDDFKAAFEKVIKQ